MSRRAEYATCTIRGDPLNFHIFQLGKDVTLCGVAGVKRCALTIEEMRFTCGICRDKYMRLTARRRVGGRR